jgi:hypothetical protein
MMGGTTFLEAVEAPWPIPVRRDIEIVNDVGDK